MPKKISEKPVISHKAGQSGPVTRAEVEQVASRLTAMAAQLMAVSDEMAEHEFGVIQVWGWKRAERGVDLLQTWCNKAEVGLFEARQCHLCQHACNDTQSCRDKRECLPTGG